MFRQLFQSFGFQSINPFDRRFDAAAFKVFVYLFLGILIQIFRPFRIAGNGNFNVVFADFHFAFHYVARFRSNFHHAFYGFVGSFAHKRGALQNDCRVVVKRGNGYHLVVFIYHQFDRRVDIHRHARVFRSFRAAAERKHRGAECKRGA